MNDGSKLVLSLFDYSGSWSRPYADAGYNVVRVDIAHPEGTHQVADNVWHVGRDVREFVPLWPIYAVLAAPDCSCFCRPAARWWKRQDATGKTRHAVEAMRAALQLCKRATSWWALENPPGRHASLVPELGRPSWQFQPYEYGDPWSKQTYIWGTAQRPEPRGVVEPPPTRRTPNGKTQGVIAFMSSSWKRKREETPPGFSAAFFEANP